MIMKQITAITLNGCNRCESLKSRLKLAGISYEEVDCDRFSGYCDALEAATNTEGYPMAILHLPNALELYYVVDEYSDIHLKGTNIDGYTLMPQVSTEQLINSLINK